MGRTDIKDAQIKFVAVVLFSGIPIIQFRGEVSTPHFSTLTLVLISGLESRRINTSYFTIFLFSSTVFAGTKSLYSTNLFSNKVRIP